MFLARSIAGILSGRANADGVGLCGFTPEMDFYKGNYARFVVEAVVATGCD